MTTAYDRTFRCSQDAAHYPHSLHCLEYRERLAYPVYPGPDTRWHLVWREEFWGFLRDYRWQTFEAAHAEAESFRGVWGPSFIVPCGHPQEEPCTYFYTTIQEEVT